MTKHIARLAALAALMLPAACVVEEGSESEEMEELESADEDTAADTEVYVKPIKTAEDCNYYKTNDPCHYGCSYWYLDVNSDASCGDRVCICEPTK